MVLSFIQPSTCGFARGIAWQVAKEVDEKIKCQDNESRQEHQARQMQERFKRYCAVFATNKENFLIEYQGFRKILPDLRKKFREWNRRKIQERNQYTGAFNIKSWNALTLEQQGEHSLQNCSACRKRYSNIQSLFPVKSKRFIGCTRKKTPLLSVEITSSQECQSPANKLTQRQSADLAKEIYSKINPSFQKACNISFAKALTNVSEMNLGVNMSKVEKKKKTRNQYRKAKKSAEAQWESTSVIRYCIFYCQL